MKAAERLQRASLGAAVGLLRAIGPAAASNLGGAVARLIGPALPVSRVADGNLRRAMPELDRAARLRIVRGVWDNLGRTIAELPHLHAIPKDSPAGPGWEMIGEEFLHAQAARGGPAIFVSGHLGNWEMMPPAVATYGMRMHSMYRAPSNRVVDEFLLDLRRRAMGLDADGKLPLLFPKGAAGARTAMKHLIGGGYLGFLVDQKMNLRDPRDDGAGTGGAGVAHPMSGDPRPCRTSGPGTVPADLRGAAGAARHRGCARRSACLDRDGERRAGAVDQAASGGLAVAAPALAGGPVRRARKQAAIGLDLVMTTKSLGLGCPV